MRLYARLLFASLLFLLFSCKQAEEKKPILPEDNLIPVPASLTKGEGQFTLTDSTVLFIDTANAELKKLAAYFTQLIAPATGFSPKLMQKGTGDHPGIYLSLDPTNNAIQREGYELTVTTTRIDIKGAAPAGVFYGIQTLRQLLPNAIEGEKAAGTAWTVPAVTIKDHPEYEYRSSMLDVGRHFFTVEDVKRYIDFLAFYKMNALHIGLTNDQGWRIEIKSWPNLTTIGGSTEVGGRKGNLFYTQEQYKEIVQYAADRYITIIPEIDMPGHTNAALASYASLNCNDTATQLYTGTEVGFSSLCTSKDITYKFIEDVIRELAAITPGPYIHIGGDESHATKLEDYIPFMEKVQAIVKKNGKLAIGWDEIAKSKLEPNTIAQYWADAANSTMAVQKGARLMMSPARKAYLDMQYDSTTRLGLHWAAYIEVDSAYIWDPATLEPGIKRSNILGVEAALWTETIAKMDDLEYMVFPRLPGYAEISWSPASLRNWDTYKVRLGNHAGRMKAMKIDYYASKKVEWNE